MRPAIASADPERRGEARAQAAAETAGEGHGTASAGPAASAPTAAPPAPQTLANLSASHPEVARAFAALQEISRKVRAEADYVGTKFAEEARRIHYGETEARQIYGEASKKDVEGLEEEGITALMLMPLPEDGQ